jgi:2-polyprenyl-6-methoxyphenol hydroxylase-like FAD-dependent oxidoreductase
MSQEKAVIIGGGIAGLSAALALQARGLAVTVVERDPSPSASVGWSGSEAWRRRGAPHALQPHVLTARLRNAVNAWYPGLARALRDAGVWEMGFAEMVHPVAKGDYRPEPGDDDITILMSRRTTLELAMRRYVAGAGVATIVDGVKVASLLLESGGPPVVVRGVRVQAADGVQDLAADIVIDASGRFAGFCDQLRAAGAQVGEEHHVSHSAYFTRHYRLLPGQRFPGVYGLPAAAFADMTVAAFPADNGAIVVTIGAFKDDPLLFDALADVEVFEAVCRATPRVAEWIDPALSRPTTDVMGWANMDFLWRSLVHDGVAQARGFFFVGDTALRSNPKYGRGCTCAVIGARLLAEVLGDEPDPDGRLRRYEAALRSGFRSEWEELLAVDAADHRRFQVAAGLARGGLGDAVRSRFQDLLLHRAMLCDPQVQRALLRGFYGLGPPSAWTRDPAIWARIAGAAVLPGREARVARRYAARPSRAQIAEWIETRRRMNTC